MFFKTVVTLYFYNSRSGNLCKKGLKNDRILTKDFTGENDKCNHKDVLQVMMIICIII